MLFRCAWPAKEEKKEGEMILYTYLHPKVNKTTYVYIVLQKPPRQDLKGQLMQVDSWKQDDKRKSKKKTNPPKSLCSAKTKRRKRKSKPLCAKKKQSHSSIFLSILSANSSPYPTKDSNISK